MADRNPVSPEESTSLSPQGQDGVTVGNQTNDQLLARLTAIESQLGVLPELQQQVQRVDKKADRIRERIYGRLAKTIEAKEQAYREVAANEGWDEATLNARLRDVRIDALGSLSSKELEALDTEDPSTGSGQAPAPGNAGNTPQYPAPPYTQPGQGQARGPQPPAQTGSTDAPPNVMLDAAQQHANALRSYLATLGLNEADMGDQGILPYVLQAEGSDGHRRWLRDLNAALDRKDDLARTLAQRQEREGFAREVQNEIEEYGDLGGAGASGGGTPSNNANLLIEKELKQFRGTGNVAEALQRKRALEQRLKR